MERSTRSIVGMTFAMAIALAGRMLISMDIVPSTNHPHVAVLLPLDFIASSWKPQQQHLDTAAQSTNTSSTSYHENVILFKTSKPTSVLGVAATTDGNPQPISTAVFEKGHQQEQDKSTFHNNNPELHNTQASSPPIAIFYNIFIPPLDDVESGVTVANALRIVTEQIHHIRQSHAASPSSSSISDKNTSNQTAVSPVTTLFYNTMGHATALNHSFMENLCTKNDSDDRHRPMLRCRHLQHYTVGNEEHTLQRLHDFCSVPAHSNHTTIYLHSKGSFHYRPYNEAWRPHLTAAATSRMCVDAVWSSSSSSSSCNLCGLQFYPLWTFFVPGNMFTASCSYVQKLLPLSVFQERMQQVEQTVRQDLPRRQGGDVDDDDTAGTVWKATLYPWSPMTVGTKRWSNEHWIASHPDVRPCDLSPTARLQPWQKEQRQQQQSSSTATNRTKQHRRRDYDWAMAPRHPITSMRYQLNLKRLHHLLALNETNINDSSDHRILPQDNDRLREWFLLPGMLMKWNTLYRNNHAATMTALSSSSSSSSSWIWQWFPDGDYWRESVQRWGLNQTVARILNNTAT